MTEDPTQQTAGGPKVSVGAPRADAGDETRPTAARTVDAAAAERGGRRRALRIARKALTFAAALFLFVLAIQLMKGGAKAIAPNIQGSFVFDNGASTLGFGWLSAYIVLSGSPVAAVTLSLFDGGVISVLQAFTMLSGSRLGAAFIVLLTGFLYAVRNRGRNRSESIGMGVQALSLTAIVYVPGMLIGYWLLRSRSLSGVQWHASGELLSVIDVVWGPVVDAVERLTSAAPWILLPAGLGVLLVSFRLLDHVLPQLSNTERAAGKRAAWLKKPWPMFLLGCVVATLTLSVSVALTVLVPLASKGYIKRKEAIPYIMGANITTLADTLVAAMLLGNPVGVQIVLAEAIGVSAVTIMYLALVYRPISNGITSLDRWVVGDNRHLIGFMAAIFAVPIILVTSGLWLGLFTG